MSAVARGKRLRIGVRDHEINAVEPQRDHVVDGVAAGSTEHRSPVISRLQIESFAIWPLMLILTPYCASLTDTTQARGKADFP